ncbi:MAG TPA: 2Fe-2S iron-sulfur cluster-binding protein [Gallionella sp.]|nr:2Fe-2S iron-sulfur cluster-binding protein [Gallionella sp.]
MPVISVRPSGITIEAAEGSRLLDALKNSGADIQHKCDGQAQCGSCHIYIHEGRKSLSRIQRTENEKLDSIIGVSSKSRLACQVMLGNENISVELLGFSSGF